MDTRTLVPAWELRKEKIAAIKRTIQEELYRRCSTELHLPNTADIIMRDLTAKDLELNRWITPTQKQGEWSFWVNMEVHDQQYIAIYKVTQITQNPKVHTMRLTVAHAARGIFDLDTMYGILPVLHKLDEFKDEKWLGLTFTGLEEIRMEAYLLGVCMIPQHTQFSIEIVSSFDNEGDWLVLGGYVAEPIGLKVC